MCGIAGSYGFSQQTKEIISKMNQSLVHRGPDGSGTLTSGSVGLAHRRLSIIDRKGGAQPMSTKDKRYTIIYNGEIYNFLQLKNELEKLGCKFQTNSDTEVVLQAFVKWGEKSFDKLNGMFGVAIYDAKSDKLVLARDHFGIKPLYFWHNNNQLLFASEIKALLASGKIDKKPNDRIIYRYLKFRVQDDTDETFFDGICRLLPGQMLTIDKNGMKISRYTNLVEELKELANQGGKKYSEEIADEYGQRLRQAVRMRLMSEVPVGTSLSGGLDSSAVAAIISRELQEHATDQSLNAVGAEQNTFSAVFPNSANDEEQYVDALLDKYQNSINAHKIKPDASQFLKDLKDFVRTQEEPIISTGPYAQYAVMREASKHVTVLLDGQGADEMIAGYNPYFYVYLKQLKRQKRYGDLLRELWTSRDIVRKLIRHKVMGRKDQPIDDFLDEDFMNRFSQETLSITPDNLKLRLVEDTFQNSLPSLLRYEDRNTMRFSLEGRVPFIDKDLAKFLFSLDESAIIHGGWNKRILRDSMDGVLPHKIARRRNKIGFTTPEDEWFLRIKNSLYGIFASEEFASRSYFRASDVVKAFEKFIQHPERYSTMTFWRLLNLELWLREFFDAPKVEIDEEAPKSDYQPNHGKEIDLVSSFDDKTYARYPLQTELVNSETNIEDFVMKYVEKFFAHLPKGELKGAKSWNLFISEKIVAISQGRSYFIWDIKPRWSAKFISRFVARTPAGIGLGSPATMELAIREAGLGRILLATIAGAFGKLIGKKGWFYIMAGADVRAIDGPTEYSVYPANVSAKLPPKDPAMVAEQLSTAIRHAKISEKYKKMFNGTVVIDANDIGRNVLGKDASGDNEKFEEMFADNPLGQARQRTPLSIVVEK